MVGKLYLSLLDRVGDAYVNPQRLMKTCEDYTRGLGGATAGLACDPSDFEGLDERNFLFWVSCCFLATGVA